MFRHDSISHIICCFDKLSVDLVVGSDDTILFKNIVYNISYHIIFYITVFVLKSSISPKKLINSSIKETLFIIGEPEGFKNSLNKENFEEICLSKLTFTHSLARVLLTEQIYRCAH